MKNQEANLIDLNEFEQVKVISTGKISKKYKIIHKATHKVFIAQIFNSELDTSKDNLTAIKKESNMVSSLSHPSINKFIGYSLRDFMDKSNCLVTISKLPKQDSLGRILALEKNHKQSSIWNDTKKLINIFGIASGMSYLHRHGIIHQRLNPEIILEDSNFYPKISDFGFSKFKRTIESDRLDLTIEQSGFIIYTAPEIMEGEGFFDSSCDVFSFGVIILVMLCNLKSQNQFSLYRMIQDSPKDLIDPSIPDCYSELILRCVQRDASKRPTFDEIVDLLKNDPRFITNSIDKNEFNKYVKYTEEGKPANLGDEEEDIEEIVRNNPLPFSIDTKKVNLANFTKKESIGSGGFGDVFKVIEKKSDKCYAAKVSKEIIGDNSKNDKLGINLTQEVTILASLSHPSILKFVGFSSFDFEDQLKPTIITEYLKNGSLEELLEYERDGYSEYFEDVWNDTMKLIVIYGIALSMLFIHSHNIIHRDMKPQNVIFDDFLFEI